MRVIPQLAAGAMGAWLAEEAARGRLVVTPVRWPVEDVPVTFIGTLGE